MQRMLPSSRRNRNRTARPVPRPDAKEEQSSRVARLLKASNEGAKSIRAQFVGFLLLLAYVGVTVFSIEDVHLLLNDGAKLPLIGTEVPIEAFFFFAPAFVLVYHYELLVQLMILGRNAGRLSRAIRRRRGLASTRLEVDSFMLTYGTAGPDSTYVRALLKLPLVLVIYVFPPVFLAWMQAAFLPFQSESITWWHRVLVLADVLVLALVIPRTFVFQPNRFSWVSAAQRTSARLAHRIWQWGMFVPMLAAVLAFSFIAALIPEERLELALLAIVPASKDSTVANNRLPSELALTRWFFFPLGAEQRRKSADNCIDRQEDRRLHRTLDLCRRIVLSPNAKADLRGEITSGDAKGLKHVVPATLVGRSLRYANFYAAYLPLANFSESDLRGANFADADLRFASFDGADLLNANFFRANLTGAKLGGDSEAASLDGARFDSALMTCSSLLGVNSAKNTTFRGATMAGADLSIGNFAGTDFTEANLVAASLEAITVDGATRFNKAQIQFSRILPVDGVPDFRSVALPAKPIAYAQNDPRSWADMLGYVPRQAAYLTACLEGLKKHNVALQP